MNTRHLQPAALRGRRWRGLVRESTAEQARKDATPERQRADLRRAAEELGMIGVEPLFYERVGSGEAEDVPELARALEDGRAGHYDVLVVFHTSRFARNRAEAVTMKREFKRAGIVIYFASQRLISGSFTSALSEGISEVLDEHENEQRRLWIAGGLRERQRSGRWTGSIPYGYRRQLVDFRDGTRGWDGALEPDPETAPVVRDMFDRFLSGASSRSIAFALNLAGGRRPSGAVWQAGTVRVILSNPVYAGHLVRYRDKREDQRYYDRTDPSDGYVDLGVHFPAIVDETVFAATQSLLASIPHSTGRQRSRYPLTGLLRCLACGYTMTGAHSRDYRYYRCRGRYELGICTQPSIRAESAERMFADWLSTLKLPADWRDELARTRVRAAKVDEGDRQRKLGERLARVRKLYAWGEMPEDDFRREAAELRTQMAVMEMPETGSLEDVAAALEDVGGAWAWPSVPDEIRAAIPPLMLKKAEVSGDHIEWVVRAELKPLIDLCVIPQGSLYSAPSDYSVRFSA